MLIASPHQSFHVAQFQGVLYFLWITPSVQPSVIHIESRPFHFLLSCSTVPLAVLHSPIGRVECATFLSANLVNRAFMKLSESLKCAPWNLGTQKIVSWLVWENESGLWQQGRRGCIGIDLYAQSLSGQGVPESFV